MKQLPPPILPNWHPRKELSRPSAEQISRAENRKRTLTYAGQNAVIPLVYGEQLVSGPVIAGPVIDPVTGYAHVAIALCWAGANGIQRIEDVRLGDVVSNVTTITDPNVGAPGGISVGGRSVSYRVFDGRQTTPWSDLASAIPGFNDAFEGVAYAYAYVADASGGLDNLMRLAFRVKGRRCRDPRTNTVAWTENPVLHMHDFVTNDEFGMGANLIGGAEAADVADSLFSGVPRTRAGITIQDPMTEEEALALFSTYAEVLWSYDGRDVAIIPDAPADVIHEIPADTIREGSLQLSTAGLEEIPTQVRVMFSDREEPTWASRPAVSEIPEHQMHGLPTSPSSVPLPGIYNRLEAERRAYQRLMRLQAPGRIQWQMFAPGMPYQAGDVVRLPDIRGLQSVDVRLTAQPEMIAPLLYQMGGEIYRESIYPVGADGVAVPTGAILIWRGSGAPPAGWQQLSIDDRLIREGSPGNAGTQLSVSAPVTLTPAGEHLGTQLYPNSPIYNSPPPPVPPWTGTPILYMNQPGSPALPSELHTHGAGVSFQLSNVFPRRQMRFVRRTGSPALLPSGIAFLGAKNLSSIYVAEAAGVSGGYLAGGATQQSSGGSTSSTFTTSVRAAHMHNPYVMQPTPGGEQIVSAENAQPAGAHSHSGSGSITAQLRSMALTLFESMGDAALVEGSIVGWEGATAPAGWAFCDGSSGTIDLRDRFIYLVATEQAGTEHADSSTYTITASGQTSAAGGHSHNRTFTLRTTDGTLTAPSLRGYHDSYEPDHSHGYSASASGSLDNIQRYQLRFIQYIGG